MTDNQVDHWKVIDLMSHVVDAAFTAADIDDGNSYQNWRDQGGKLLSI